VGGKIPLPTQIPETASILKPRFLLRGKKMKRPKRPQREQLRSQNRFLEALEKLGTIKDACEHAGVNRLTMKAWVRDDSQGFTERYIEAEEVFADSLERMAYDRVAQQSPRDNPVLLIALLNAHKPAKYRPGTAVSESTAREVMAEWRKRRAELEARFEKGQALNEAGQLLDTTPRALLEATIESAIPRAGRVIVEGDIIREGMPPSKLITVKRILGAETVGQGGAGSDVPAPEDGAESENAIEQGGGRAFPQ
jgi:hypothetical protein